MPAQVGFPVGPLSVEPGGEASCHLRLHNLGRTADRFSLQPLGSMASWTTFDPPVVALAANATALVTAHFRPPRLAHVRAGCVPFGVLVTSAGDKTSAVAERLLTIGRFAELTAELLPPAARGRRARFTLEVRNDGNSTRHLSLLGTDPAGRLHIDCTPNALTIFPGTVASATVRVRRLGRAEAPEQAFTITAQSSDDTGEAPLRLTGRLRRGRLR